MVAPGETDLAAMLANLAVTRRPGTYRYVELADPDPANLPAILGVAEAMVREGGTTTLVVRAAAGPGADGSADIAGEPPEGSVLDVAWLTLTVPSSLEAVGLTAAVSAALAAAGIPCNVLAGVRHDHLLVPVERADDAVRVLVADARSTPASRPADGR